MESDKDELVTMYHVFGPSTKTDQHRTFLDASGLKNPFFAEGEFNVGYRDDTNVVACDNPSANYYDSNRMKEAGLVADLFLVINGEIVYRIQWKKEWTKDGPKYVIMDGTGPTTTFGNDLYKKDDLYVGHEKRMPDNNITGEVTVPKTIPNPIKKENR
jgi:hypothetical protein